MAKRKSKYKVRNGSYHTLIYDYTDINGKRIYKSFTAPTVDQLDLMVSQFKIEKHQRQLLEEKTGDDRYKLNISMQDATRRYIDSSENVLSPSTIRGYETTYSQHIEGTDFGKILLSEITNMDIQEWISGMQGTRYKKQLSPKTISNNYGLVSATLHRYMPYFQLNVTLPKKQPAKRYTPTDEDVQKVISMIESPDLLAVILLYAFGPLRRSEACALTWDDIHGNFITINKALVKDKDLQWICKPYPKTESSFRTVDFPEFVIERLPQKPKGERIISTNPDRLSQDFVRAIDKAGLPHFSLHDLRHYSASIMHALGVPDKYVMQRGGWSTDQVMKNIYMSAMDAEQERQNEKINAYFSSIANTPDNGYIGK